MRRISMKRTVAAVLVVTLAAPSVLLAKVNSERAAYFGGSVAMFAGAKDPVEGKLDTVNEEMLILRADKKPYVGQELRIPYKRIQDLEYGQKAGRRVGAAVGYTVLLGPLGLLTLFSKKRNHYLTVAWKDDADKEQVAVLELGKDIVRSTLPIVKARSGKEITYQDEESRKSSGT
jgi:hypothetical protein